MYECDFKTRGLRCAGLALALSVLLGATVAAADTAPRSLIPVGHTVGVKLFARGVMVVKLAEGGTPARACGLKTGDVIVTCGGTAVTSTEQFQALLQENGTQATDLQIRRGSGAVTLSVEPECGEEGVCRIGAWIRDSMAGIGTLTYYDPESGSFGALGHGITDCDTALLMPFDHGSILPSTVKAVKKGEAGSAGELRGDFELDRELGQLYANTASGVFGTLEDPACLGTDCTPLPTAQAAVGPAVIRSNVCGDEVRDYTVEIVKVSSGAAEGRELILNVTDPELIAQTGGIVQGMSGSPILQDGAVVGAVTHVLVNNPCKGYGILIETMLSAAERGGSAA